jgi:mannose-6-phosphate isomerase-like protein (cupin superfamily)
MAGVSAPPEKFNLDAKFSLFAEQWRPKIVAALNGQEVKIVKVHGTFPWHHHDNEDEFFLVWKGRFRIEFRDRVVDLGPVEGLVVPRGVEHRTAADDEAEVLLFEPAATRNTGNVVDAAFTAPDGVTV